MTVKSVKTFFKGQVKVHFSRVMIKTEYDLCNIKLMWYFSKTVFYKNAVLDKFNRLKMTSYIQLRKGGIATVRISIF